jgi:hypothetical protein
LLSVSLFPCRRSHPARVVRRVSQCATAHAAFTFTVAGSASGAIHFRGHRCVRLRYSLETRHHPADGAVERLQRVGFPSPCAPSYRALAFPLVGLPPTAHASLRWTHHRACTSQRTRLSILRSVPEAYFSTVSIRMTSFSAWNLRTVSLSLSCSLSSVLPRLIRWLIQCILAAQPMTGKRRVRWRLRYPTGVRTQANHQRRQSCLSA